MRSRFRALGRARPGARDRIEHTGGSLRQPIESLRASENRASRLEPPSAKGAGAADRSDRSASRPARARRRGPGRGRQRDPTARPAIGSLPARVGRPRATTVRDRSGASHPWPRGPADGRKPALGCAPRDRVRPAAVRFARRVLTRSDGRVPRSGGRGPGAVAAAAGRIRRRVPRPRPTRLPGIPATLGGSRATAGAGRDARRRRHSEARSDDRLGHHLPSAHGTVTGDPSRLVGRSAVLPGPIPRVVAGGSLLQGNAAVRLSPSARSSGARPCLVQGAARIDENGRACAAVDPPAVGWTRSPGAHEPGRSW